VPVAAGVWAAPAEDSTDTDMGFLSAMSIHPFSDRPRTLSKTKLRGMAYPDGMNRSGKTRARGGPRTTFPPLRTLDSRGNTRNPPRSDRRTTRFDPIRSEGQGVQIVRTLIRARFVAGQNSAVTLMTGISVTGSTHPTAYVPNMVRISSRCRFH
jgi:hypothetical protein